MNQTTPSATLETKTVKTSTPRITPTFSPTLDLRTLPEELPQSMKGYELVSWEVNGVWNYTLITGTNREKTFEELMSFESSVNEDGWVKISVTGEEQILKVLALLPKGEEVLWDGMDLSGQVPEGTLYFSFPSEKTMERLINACREQGVHLYSLKEAQ